MAQLAQSVEVRRSGGAVTGVGVTLADTVARVLWDEGMNRASVTWDARRRDDGKWVVTASFMTERGPVQAAWTYDNAGRNLRPIDETARRLMGVAHESLDEPRTAQLVPVRAPEPAPDFDETRPRLVSVHPVAEPAPGFRDNEAPFAHGATARLDSEESRLDQEERLLELERREHELRAHELREHQMREHELREHELREHQMRERELREHELREHQRREQELLERERELREQQAREQARQMDRESVTEARSLSHQPTVALPREEPPNSGGKPKPKPKSRRASVPSWDEILFGATRSDET